MRITNQMMAHNLIKVMGKAEVPAHIKELIGKIVEGQVIKVDGQTLALSIEGNSIEMTNQSTHTFQKGDWVEAEIIDFKEGAFFVSMKSKEPEGQSSPLSLIIQKVGLPLNTESKALVEAMIKYDIPVTADHVNQMKQTVNEVRVLLGELDKLPIDIRNFIVANLDKPIKELVLPLIQHKNVDPASPQQINESELQSSLIDIQKSDVTIKPGFNQNSMENAQAIMDGLKEILRVDSRTSDFEVVKSLLENFDFDREGLVFKEKLPITLKSLMLVESVVQNDKGLSERFVKVIELLDRAPILEKSLPALVSILTDEVEEHVKIENIFKWVNESELPQELKRELSKELFLIKETAQAPKLLPDTISFYQFPVQINNELKTVDMYFKSKNNKIDMNDMTLLIALETHNYGEVRCLIHKLDSAYELSFNLKEKEVRDVFESYSLELETALRKIGVTFKKIKYNVNMMDFTNEVMVEKNPLSKIDMKV